MINALTGFPDNVVAVACSEHVTRDDYDRVLVPRVNEALARHKKIRLYYEIGANFTGIDPGAVWKDIAVGAEHLLRWERAAVVTDVDWIRHTIRAFGFLMPGDMRVFPLTQQAQAREWIVAAER